MRARHSILFLLLTLAAPVRAQWQPNGNPLNGGGFPEIVTDGSGGAIVSWGYWDPWGGQWAFAMGQRLSAGGNELWQPGGRILCPSSDQSWSQLVSDGAGGAIFVWLDNRNGFWNIYAQRIDASGAEQWAPCGVAVRIGNLDVDTSTNLAVVSDGSGGAIIAWADPRVAGMDIYARRIDAAGTALWTFNGNPVCIAAQGQVDPVAVADGSGGAWIAWVDSRNGNADIYARHMAANGYADGIADGFALCTATGIQWRAQIAPDESGGAIVAWQDERAGADVFAQRVSSAGTTLWTTDGIAVCSEASYQETPTIASDGDGGAVVVWKDGRTQPAGGSAFYAQRVNGAGQTQWTADGNLLGISMSYPGGFREHAVIADGSGESIVTWVEDTHDEVTFQPVTIIRVQRLGASGETQWTPGGVELIHNDDITNSGVRYPALVSDGWGGAIVAWEDWRYWQASAVYAAHVSPSGTVTDVHAARGPSMTVANVYPNPFAGTASIAVELPASSKVEVDIFDVAGRKVRSFVDNDAARSKVIQIADRDHDGRLLPSGVYFCRIRAAGETVTRKMVIAR